MTLEDDDKAKSHYVGERGRQYHAGFDIAPRAVQWVGRLRAEKLTKEVGPDDVVLEYGVGGGWNLLALKCRRRLGFDVGDHLASRIEALGIEFVHSTAHLPDGSVDVVLCHHVLEHVLMPHATLREMERLLGANGRLLLYVPFEREKRYRSFDRNEVNHHLYSWNVQTLSNLVEEAGLSVITATLGRYGYDRFASVWATRLGLGESGFRLLRAAVHAIRPGYEVRLVAKKKKSADD